MPHNTLTYRHNLTIYNISIVENMPVCQRWLDSKRAYFMDKIRRKQVLLLDKISQNLPLSWTKTTQILHFDGQKTPILILFHGQIHARLKLKCLFAPDSTRRLLRALRSLFFFSLLLTRLGSLSEKAFAKKMLRHGNYLQMGFRTVICSMSIRLIFQSGRSG